jgi:DNA repair protein RadC
VTCTKTEGALHSGEDQTITSRLVQAGELLGIKILDHVVIGDGRYISFADEGLL